MHVDQALIQKLFQEKWYKFIEVVGAQKRSPDLQYPVGVHIWCDIYPSVLI